MTIGNLPASFRDKSATVQFLLYPDLSIVRESDKKCTQVHFSPTWITSALPVIRELSVVSSLHDEVIYHLVTLRSDARAG
jgi:hypothetical protein